MCDVLGSSWFQASGAPTQFQNKIPQEALPAEMLPNGGLGGCPLLQAVEPMSAKKVVIESPFSEDASRGTRRKKGTKDTLPRTGSKFPSCLLPTTPLLPLLSCPIQLNAEPTQTSVGRVSKSLYLGILSVQTESTAASQLQSRPIY